MASLSIRLFGIFELQRDGKPLAATRTRKEQSLLALLALHHPHPVERSWLAGTLWPDSAEGQARDNLRHSLTHLRAILGADACRLVAERSWMLRLEAAGADVDVITFDEDLASGDPARLERAVSLYRGPLLTGCDEEWILPERHSRAQGYCEALESLAEQTRISGRSAQAISWLRRLLIAEPLREDAVRRLMQALAEQGDQASVIQAYRDFRLLLHRELGAQPDPETTALYRCIRAEAKERARPALRPTVPVPAVVRRLPSPVTTLIGREREIETISTILQASRLVTLTGSGGVGKTRLALAVAEDVSAEFTDGACFVDLSPLKDSARAVQAVAQALDVRESPNRPLLESLLARLRDHSILLILDNCEHMAAACADLADSLLAACPDVRIMATSRQPLGTAGERTWRVPSLTLPVATQGVPGPDKDDYAILMGSEAGRLFVERATAASPAFRLTRENIIAVADTCRSLDGIPLALELAAAWVRVLPVTQLASRLRGRLDLLQSQHTTAPARQQALRATLDWSYGLLDEADQRLLRHLSVFVGGWTLDAAEAVCGDSGERTDRVLLGLACLVDRSLVVYEPQEGSSRYRLLETTRQYAREKLQESGEEAAILVRHRDYYLRQLECGLGGRVNYHAWDRVPWHQWPVYEEWCELERGNCREALRFSLAEPDGAVAAMRLAACLWNFWLGTGDLTEGRSWLSAALNKDSGAPSHIRLRALRDASGLAMLQGDNAAGRSLAEEGLALARAHEPAYVVHLLDILGYVSGSDALSIWEERAALARQDGDPALMADALASLGKHVLYAGRPEEASPLLEEALACAIRSHDANYIMNAKAGLADLAALTGDREKAHQLLQEILAVLRRAKYNPHMMSWPCYNMGGLKRDMGDFPAMRAYFREALRCFQRVEAPDAVLKTLEHIALGEHKAFPSPGSKRAEWSVRLLGAVERHKELCGYRGSDYAAPSETVDGMESVSRMREALGEDAFEAAWAEGSSMTLDEAIAYALRD